MSTPEVANVVKNSAKTVAKAASVITDDISEGLKDTVGHITDAAGTVVKTTAKVGEDAASGASDTVAGLFKTIGDDVMQMICVILLGVILIMINPVNSAVTIMRRWWVRLIAVVFLVLVLFAERSKPRVSILLGLVILALILFSDMPFVQSESFYGRTPKKVDFQEDVPTEGLVNTDQAPVAEFNQMTQEDGPVPVDSNSAMLYAPVE